MNPRGDTFRQEYNVYLFSDVASRAVGDLVTEGVLKLEESYHYELVVDASVATSPGPALAGMSFGSGPKHEPLQQPTRGESKP